MYIEENIEKLNQLYGHIGIQFEWDNNLIKVKEKKKFTLNEHYEIKELLKEKFGMTFNKRDKWFIRKSNEEMLKKKKIKSEPIYSPKRLAIKIKEYILKIKEVRLRESIIQLLKNHRNFFNAPAAKIIHHDYQHGLLEHTVQTIEFAISIANSSNQTIDEDILIAGALLHDIGKINCYDYSEQHIKLTEIFIKQNHIINGIKIISQELKTKKLDEIIHIIASHHNLKEWGSSIPPNSIEAWIIHFSDNISGKIG